MPVDSEKRKIQAHSVINNSLKSLIATLMLQFDICQIVGIVSSSSFYACTC